MNPPRVRGNFPVLFLLFFAVATALAGATYQAFEMYTASAGSLAYALVAAATGAGFAFSMMVVARILYKAAG